MNILFVTDFKVEATHGGVQRITETLAFEFISRNISVSYLSLTEGQTEVTNGVVQYYMPKADWRLTSESIGYVNSLLRNLNIDIIVFQSALTLRSLRLINRSKPSEVKLISVHHNSIASVLENYSGIITENFSNRKWFRFLDNQFGWMLVKWYHLRKYGKDISFSISSSDLFILYFPEFIKELGLYNVSFDPDRVISIPNPLPFPVVEHVFAFKENVLLFVGRLNYSQKRVDLLLEIWEQIFALFPTWRLEIVGDGPKRDELEHLCKDRGLDRVFFHGYQDPRPFFTKAKMFCMTSAFEGFGMVLVEAQAYGVVPLAFNCFSALGEIIDSGKTGVVVDPFDVEKYSHELGSLMKDEERRKRMAVAGQKSVARFNSSLIADKWVQAFRSLLTKSVRR